MSEGARSRTSDDKCKKQTCRTCESVLDPHARVCEVRARSRSFTPSLCTTVSPQNSITPLLQPSLSIVRYRHSVHIFFRRHFFLKLHADSRVVPRCAAKTCHFTAKTPHAKMESKRRSLWSGRSPTSSSVRPLDPNLCWSRSRCHEAWKSSDAEEAAPL